MPRSMFRTSSPVLNDKTFDVGRNAFGMPDESNAMTLEGTATKTLFLLALVVAAASITWGMVNGQVEAARLAEGGLAAGFDAVMPWLIGGWIGGLITAFVIIFKKTWAPFLAPVYAVFEGLALGGLSAMLEAIYPDIVIQAVGLTFGTMFCLLIAYRSGLIKVTEKFRLGVVAATGGIAMVYLAGFVLGFFGVSIPYIHGSGLIGIGFSCFVVVIAALNLVLNFDFIETGVQRRMPKFMEWYAGFGLLVTLVWLYIEILILLSKLRGRD